MKVNRFFISVIMASMVFCVGFTGKAVCAETGVTDDSVKIGGQCVLTGMGLVGIAGMYGMQMVVDEVNNAGGIHGRKLKLVVEDDACEPTKNIAAFRKLVAEGVFMVVGGNCSHSTLAALPVLKSAKVPYVTSGVGTEKLCDPFDKYVFQPTVVPNRVQGWNVAEFIAKVLKVKRVAILNLAAEYGIAVTEGCMDRLKEFGLELVSHEVMNMGDIDFTSQILKIKAAKPDVLVTPIYYREGLILYRQIRELGLDCKVITFPPCQTYQFMVEGGDTLKGIILQAYQPNPPPEINPRLNEFFKKFKQLHPVEDPVDALIGASAMRVVIEGLRRAGRDLTRDKFVEALETLRNFDPVLTSPCTFTSTDHRGCLASKYWVFEGGGKRTWLPDTVTWTKPVGFKYEK